MERGREAGVDSKGNEATGSPFNLALADWRPLPRSAAVGFFTGKAERLPVELEGKVVVWH